MASDRMLLINKTGELVRKASMACKSVETEKKTTHPHKLLWGLGWKTFAVNQNPSIGRQKSRRRGKRGGGGPCEGVYGKRELTGWGVGGK